MLHCKKCVLHLCHHEIVISRSVYDVITENKTKNQKYCNFEFMLERMFELNIYYFEYSKFSNRKICPAIRTVSFITER